MATASSKGFVELTGQQNLLLDLVALIVGPLMVTFLFGVTSFEISIYGGYNFSDPLFGWVLAGTAVSVALVLVIAATIWVVATNEFDGSDYEKWEFGIIGFVLVMPILYAFVPGFAAIVEMNDTARLAGALFWSVGLTYVAYTE